MLQQLGVGVDELVARGYLDHLKAGPLYWVDSADSQPCVGTGGVAAWSLTAYGEDMWGSRAQQHVWALGLFWS